MKQSPASARDEGRSLPELREGDEFASRYRVEKRLGSGLYGQVYLVKHLKYGRPTILKVFYPGVFRTEEQRVAFKTEFDAIKRLKHPGVPPHLEQGDWPEGNTKYCTMDFINGSSLRALVDELRKKGQRLAPSDAVHIVTKLLETLKAIHPHGVTHRNIKPENILIVAKGSMADQVKWDLRLSDFALARAPIDWMTEVDPGKLPYMSPELLGYGGEVGPRTDIFSAGVLLYEMLTGSPPGPDPAPPSSIRPGLPKKFDDIVELCLAHSQEDRYGSVEDLLFDLEQLPADIVDIAGDDTGRWWAPLAVIAGLVGIGAVIGIILWVGDKPPVTTGPEAWENIREHVRKNPNFVTETEAEIAAKRSKEPGMVYIPGGAFVGGALPGEPNVGDGERTAELVTVYGYYIDRYEFPNREGERPKTMVSWTKAREACNKRGKRLCTADEWERACKGTGSLIYGYGDTYDPTACAGPGSSGSDLRAGLFPDCHSDFGVWDMAGGVPEWVVYHVDQQTERPVVKGGLVGGDPARGTRCASIVFESASHRNPNIGFRCCK